MGRTSCFNLLIHPNATNELVEAFKSAGGSLDVTDSEYNTPLHMVQNLNIARVLLSLGAKPNAENSRGETPLHMASSQGRLGIVELLLKADADVGQRTKSGWTSLMFSSQNNISDTLLQHGAYVNAATDLGWTPLHIASDTSNGPLAAFLLSKGADVHALAARERDMWSPDLARTTVLMSDQTPLHIAVAAKGSVLPDMAATLIDHGANIEAKDSTGKTPLLLAIVTDGYSPPNEEIVNCLLYRGADTQIGDNSGRNAVQLADIRQYTINNKGRFERKPVPQPTYSPRGSHNYGSRGRPQKWQRPSPPTVTRTLQYPSSDPTPL